MPWVRFASNELGRDLPLPCKLGRQDNTLSGGTGAPQLCGVQKNSGIQGLACSVMVIKMGRNKHYVLPVLWAEIEAKF